MARLTRIYNLCGRIHLGPCLVNGGDRGQPICTACGQDITRIDRDVMQRSWDTVHRMLAPYKAKAKR